MLKVTYPAFLLLLILCMSCKDQTSTHPLTDEELAAVPDEWRRYDQMIAALDTTELTRSVETLRQAEPRLTDLYLGQIMRMVLPGDTFLLDTVALTAYLSSDAYRDIQSMIEEGFGSVEQMPSALHEALARYHKHFPERDIPHISAVNTEFGYFPFLYETALSQDAVGVSLDMFLGDAMDYTVLARQSEAFSAYNSHLFYPEYIPVKVIEILIDDMVAYPESDDLLDAMLYKGVKRHYMRKCLSHLPEHMALDYRADQLAWCRDNEEDIWRYILSDGQLYKRALTRQLTEPAPTSPGMPPASPGRAASYIGYQIIQAYEREMGADATRQLLTSRDAQSILRDSKYKPPR